MKVKSVLIFTAGVATGVYSVPATLVYVKPLRHYLIRRFAKFATELVSNDAKLRKEIIEYCEKFIEILSAYPEMGKADVNNPIDLDEFRQWIEIKNKKDK
jgi:hypothetical protein